MMEPTAAVPPGVFLIAVFCSWVCVVFSFMLHKAVVRFQLYGQAKIIACALLFYGSLAGVFWYVWLTR